MTGRVSTLSQEDVKYIKACAAERERLREEAMLLSNAMLARKFRVSPTTISCVINDYYHYQNGKEK